MMNAIDQGKKGDFGAVYGTTSMIECAHPECKEVFEKAPNKVYHSTDCKDSYHKRKGELGEIAIHRGKIRAALMENSPLCALLIEGRIKAYEIKRI